MRPSRSDLERLAQKYVTLAELRRARQRGEPPPASAFFRRLAADFPGVLKELDTLPLDEIDRRSHLLLRAAAEEDDAAVPPWMTWMHAYHALTRAALHIRTLDLPALRASESSATIASIAAQHAGVEVDDAFVRDVLRPPAGRFNPVIFARLSALFGVSAADIQRALFPRTPRPAA